MLPRLHFRQLTPTMLLQQKRDQPGLYQQNRDDGCDLPRIPLPHRWLSEIDGAGRWKVSLCNPKPLHLPPVKPWQFKLGGWNFDVTSLFSVQNTNCCRRRDRHPCFYRMHGAADDGIAEEYVEVGKDGALAAEESLLWAAC
jgi:hypothetical protein